MAYRCNLFTRCSYCDPCWFAFLAIGELPVRSLLEFMPAWLTDGLAIGGGMVVAVGYAMVINMMATKEVWPFFAIGFVLATVSEITLIGLGAIGVALALIYLALSKQGAVQVMAGTQTLVTH